MTFDGGIMEPIIVSRMWHRRGKNEFFSVKQLIEMIPDVPFEFHSVLDDFNYKDEWSDKIDEVCHGRIKYYSKDDMISYVRNFYGMTEEFTNSFVNFPHFFHILIGHYLRRVYGHEYMLTYEYDIIFNKDKDISDLKNIIRDKIPFGICEPQNSNCDKALFVKLSELFQQDLRPFISAVNPNFLGFNAGFQGINLKLFDELLSVSSFNDLISVFDFSGIFTKDGVEKWGTERTIIDTQEQSFYSIMNQIYSNNFVIMDTDKYFFKPCWEDFDGYVEAAMESAVIHFTGHNKAKKLFDIIESGV